jgi:hypothetical protein
MMYGPEKSDPLIVAVKGFSIARASGGGELPPMLLARTDEVIE